MPNLRRLSKVSPQTLKLLVLVAGPLLLGGCAAVPASEQHLVNKPGMQFSDSAVFAYSGKLLRQTETGSAVAGGGQPAGCTSCR